MTYQARRFAPTELAGSRWVRLALSLAVGAHFATAQTSAPPSPIFQTIQLEARSALFAASQPASLMLDGSFTSTEGSRVQTGTAHLTVSTDGAFIINLSRAAGPIGESRTVSDGTPSCTWTDHDNVVHNSSFLNCMPPAWFFPGLTLLAVSTDASAPAWTPSSAASDSLGDHLRFQFVLPNSDGSPQDPLLSSPFELVLAASTHLPLYALFTVHPDQPGLNTDIPVRIAYSDYRSVSGVMVPFHIQRFVNESLVLDLAITTVSVQ